MSDLEETETSPAIALKVQHNSCSVDLVPAIEFPEWPQPAQNWNPKWLPPEVVEECKRRCFVVPKLHASEYAKDPNSCRLWRFGFNHAEKLIIKHADGAHRDQAMRTCRKTVFRLLKEDLQSASNQEDLDGLCSYLIKTTMLHVYDMRGRSMAWRWKHSHGVLMRYVDCLEHLRNSLSKKDIRHYFIQSENLLTGEALKQAAPFQEILLKKWKFYFEGIKNLVDDDFGLDASGNIPEGWM